MYTGTDDDVDGDEDDVTTIYDLLQLPASDSLLLVMTTRRKRANQPYMLHQFHFISLGKRAGKLRVPTKMPTSVGTERRLPNSMK